MSIFSFTFWVHWVALFFVDSVIKISQYRYVAGRHNLASQAGQLSHPMIAITSHTNILLAPVMGVARRRTKAQMTTEFAWCRWNYFVFNCAFATSCLCLHAVKLGRGISICAREHSITRGAMPIWMRRFWWAADTRRCKVWSKICERFDCFE